MNFIKNRNFLQKERKIKYNKTTSNNNNQFPAGKEVLHQPNWKRSRFVSIQRFFLDKHQ